MNLFRAFLLAVLSFQSAQLAAQLDVSRIELISRAIPSDTAAFHVGQTTYEHAPLLSDDGRYVVFESRAANVMFGILDCNLNKDIYWLDRQSGELRLVTRQFGTALTANGAHSLSGISRDGRWILYSSSATQLTAVTLPQQESNVYLFDAQSGANVLITAGVDGTPGGNDRSEAAAISADGRFTLLHSKATNLVAGTQTAFFPPNGLYLHDRLTQQTRRVINATDSPNLPIDSSNGLISADGRWVVFGTREVRRLLTGIPPSSSDVQLVLVSLETGVASLVTASVLQPNIPANESSFAEAISDDGRRITFSSYATDVAPRTGPPSSQQQLFTHDRIAGSNALLTHIPRTLQGLDWDSTISGISRDGLWIGIRTRAGNYAENMQDTNAAEDVFLYDVASARATLVSRAHDVAVAVGGKVGLLNVDGSSVYFEAPAHLVVAGQPSSAANSLLRFDRISHTTTVFDANARPARTTLAINATGSVSVQLVDRSTQLPDVLDQNFSSDLVLSQPSASTLSLITRARSQQVAAANWSTLTDLSDDGRVVTFNSSSKVVVPGHFVDVSLENRPYSFDRQTASMRLLSSQTQTHGPGETAYSVAISGNGRFVLFNSPGRIVPNQSINMHNAFLYDRELGVNQMVSHAPGNPAAALGDSWAVAISRDGRWVLWSSPRTSIVGVEENSWEKTYLYDRETDSNLLVSRTTANATAAVADNTEPENLSSDGRHALFFSRGNVASNIALAPGQLPNLYAFDRITGMNKLVNRAAGVAMASNLGAQFSGTAMSDDGRWVAYSSSSTNLVTGFVDQNTSQYPDLYLADLIAGTSQLVSRSHASSSIGNNSTTEVPRVVGMSADGRWITFNSSATNLLPTGVAASGMYLFDRANGQVQAINGAAGVNVVRGRVFGLSEDGNRVLMTSESTLKLWDRVRNEYLEISPIKDPDFAASLSPTGATVAFVTEMTGFTPTVADGSRCDGSSVFCLDVYAADIVDTATLPLFRDGFER